MSNLLFDEVIEFLIISLAPLNMNDSDS